MNLKIILVFAVIFILAIASIFAIGIFSNKDVTGNSINPENLEKITLKVSIPCGGHAYLIKSALNSLKGIENIEYNPITTFVVYYDSTKINEQDILNLEIFKDYPAKKID